MVKLKRRMVKQKMEDGKTEKEDRKTCSVSQNGREINQ